jgi:hypothetical protein
MSRAHAWNDDEPLDDDQPLKHTDLLAEWDLCHCLVHTGWRQLPDVRARLPLDALAGDGPRAILSAAYARWEEVERLARLEDAPPVSRWDVFESDSLCAWLDEHGLLNREGGVSALHVLALGTRSVAHLDAMPYVDRILAVWPRRRQLEAALAISEGLARGVARDDPAGALTWARDTATAALEHAGGATDRFAQDDWRNVWQESLPEPLVAEHYALNTNVMVYATWSAGKTCLEMDLALHLACGWPWRTYAVTPGHVWYFMAEGQAALTERVQALLRRYGLDAVPPTFHTVSLDVPNLLEPGTAELVAGRIRAQTPAGERIVGVWFDTLAQTSLGGDESNAAMSKYVGAMTRLRLALPADKPCVRTIHHPGWDNSHSRGGSSLPAGLDTTVHISETPGSRFYVVTCEKQRVGWHEFADFAYRVVPQVVNADGRTGPVVEWVELPSEAARAGVGARHLTPQAEQAWALFLDILAEYVDTGNGVFPGTWQDRWNAAGCNPASFRPAVKQLRDKRYVHQPDTTMAYFPVDPAVWDQLKTRTTR